MTSRDPDLSITIVTLNEERNLDRCISSLPPGAEIIVLDSGSTDKTKAIAARHGAKVFERAFTNYAEQHNAACALAGRGWILSIDADEEMDEDLRRAVLEAVAQPFDAKSPGAVSAWRIDRRLVFMGRLMRWGKTADQPIRMFRRELGRFVGEVHEVVQVEVGRTTALGRGQLHHYSYADLSDYFQRFNRYTSMIADKHRGAGRDSVSTFLHVIRPWFEFLYRYIIRLGFLDGYPGYCYALLSSIYAFVKYAKLRELRRSESK
jgi:glycosyltransferase involved in cell wall biosynthesis